MKPDRKSLIILLLAFVLGFGSYIARHPFALSIDVERHLRYSRDFALSLADTAGYPDWDPRPFNGKGGAYFRYVPPLPLLSAAVFQFIGFSTPLSVKLTLVLAAAMGIWGTLLCHRLLGKAESWTTTGFLIISHPFMVLLLNHFFVFHNLFAVLILPLAAACFIMVLNDKPDGTRLLGVSLSFMAASHLLTTLVTGYAMLVGCLVAAYLKETGKLRPLISLVTASVIAAAIASPYILPAMLTGRDSDFKAITAVFTPGGENTPFLDDRIRPELSENNSISVFRSFNLILPYLSTGIRKILPFLSTDPSPGRNQPGRLPIRPYYTMNIARPWILVLTITTILFGLGSAVFGETTQTEKILIYSGIFVLSLTFSFSKPLWNLLPGLATIQFPWRCILPGSVLVSIGSSGFIQRMFRNHPRSVLIPAFSLWLFMIITFSATSVTAAHERLQTTYRLTGWQLFTPKTVVNRFPQEDHPDYWAGEYHLARLVPSQRPVTAVDLGFEWANYKVESDSTGDTMIINTHWDESWRVSVNGNEAKPVLFSDEGTISVQLPEGASTVRLYRTSPPWRTTGWILSLIALLICLSWHYFFKTQRQQPV